MSIFRKLFGSKPAASPATPSPAPAPIAPATPPAPAPAPASQPPAAAPFIPLTQTTPPAPGGNLSVSWSPPSAPAPLPSAPVEVTLLTVPGPVWLSPDSPAMDLFPAKAEDAPLIAFLGGSAEFLPEIATAGGAPVDAAGRLARALPLYLAEEIERRTAALAQTLVAWVIKPRPGFILGGKQWDDATASRHARRSEGDGPADLLVATHLDCRTEPWNIELRLVRTIDATCLATFGVPCTPADPGQALPELVRRLLAQLAEKAALPVNDAPLADPAATVVPPFHSAYLSALEQLLAVRLAGLDGCAGTLRNERQILADQLQLCEAQPASLSARLLLAQTLLGLAKIRPQLSPEYRAQVEQLQETHPLPTPAHMVVAGLFADAFATG